MQAMNQKPPNPNNDYIVPQSPSDSISSVRWSPGANFLCGTSWNKDVCVWEVQQEGNRFNAIPKAKISHSAPVLCSAWSNDNTRIFSGGCDNQVKMWTLQTNQTQVVAQHAAPVKEVFYIPERNVIVTGSWDKTLKYWDLRQSQPVMSVNLPERVYSMDVRGCLLALAMADRKCALFDIRQPQTPYRSLESPLRFQSRCISIFPDQTGFALGSIEGRVAIQPVKEQDLKDTNKTFAFKCHRDNNDVFAVNAIAFHSGYGTFATCGSDGGYTFWDKDSKQRLKLFERSNQSITCCTFSRDNQCFVYALSYDWSRGIEGYDKNKPNAIMLHALQDSEIQKKKK